MDFFRIIFDYALIIQVLVISFAVVLVLSPVERGAKGILFALLKIFVFFVAQILTITTLGVLARYVEILRGTNFLIGYMIGISVYAIFFCRFNPRAKWMMATSLMAVSIMAIEIGFNFSKLLENVIVGESTEPHIDIMGIGKCVAMLLVVLFAFLQMKFSMKDYEDIPKPAVVLVIGGSILSTLMNFLQEFFYIGVGMPDSNYLGLSGLFFLALYVVNLSTYMLAFFLYREVDKLALMKGEKQLAEDSLEMMKMTETNLSYLRRLKHDIGNQYTYIHTFLQNGQYKEAEEYLESLRSLAIVPFSFVDSGNKTIDAVLNMELSKAKANDIEVDFSVIVPPRLPFNGGALCSIISNLIDNAIEASVRYDLKKEGINVNINRRTDYLYICVDNPLPEGVDEKEILSLGTKKKQEVSEHGLGTQIVKRFAARYNGYANFTIEDGRFIAEVMLALEDKNEEEKNNTSGAPLPIREEEK